MGKSKSELGENKSKFGGNMWELLKREEGGGRKCPNDEKGRTEGKTRQGKYRPEVLCYLYSQLQVQSYNTLYPACHLLSFSISKSPKNRSLTNRHSTPYKL